MINIKVDGASMLSCHISGKLMDLMAETGIIIRSVYEGIKEIDEDSAKEYVFCVTKMFEDGILFDEKKLEKVTKEAMEGDGIYMEGEDELPEHFKDKAI